MVPRCLARSATGMRLCPACKPFRRGGVKSPSGQATGPRTSGTAAVGDLPGSPASLFIYVEDADAVIDHAAKLGPTVQHAAEDQFYGDLGRAHHRPVLARLDHRIAC